SASPAPVAESHMLVGTERAARVTKAPLAQAPTTLPADHYPMAARHRTRARPAPAAATSEAAATPLPHMKDANDRQRRSSSGEVRAPVATQAALWGESVVEEPSAPLSQRRRKTA